MTEKLEKATDILNIIKNVGTVLRVDVSPNHTYDYGMDRYGRVRTPSISNVNFQATFTFIESTDTDKIGLVQDILIEGIKAVLKDEDRVKTALKDDSLNDMIKEVYSE